MATTNDSSLSELKSHFKKTMITAAVLLAIIMLGYGAAFVFGFSTLKAPLMGGFCGVIVATLNLLAIGYAFYVMAIKKGRKAVLVLPALSFIAMCVLAYVFANFVPSMILGYALGLTTPVLFGAVVVFLG